jgi:hypothetical protein
MASGGRSSACALCESSEAELKDGQTVIAALLSVLPCAVFSGALKRNTFTILME